MTRILSSEVAVENIYTVVDMGIIKKDIYGLYVSNKPESLEKICIVSGGNNILVFHKEMIENNVNLLSKMIGDSFLPYSKVYYNRFEIKFVYTSPDFEEIAKCTLEIDAREGSSESSPENTEYVSVQQRILVNKHIEKSENSGNFCILPLSKMRFEDENVSQENMYEKLKNGDQIYATYDNTVVFAGGIVDVKYGKIFD